MTDKKPCIGYCLITKEEVPLGLTKSGKIVCFLGSEKGKPGQTTEDGVLITEDYIHLPREVSDEEWEWIVKKQDEFRKKLEDNKQHRF